MTKKIEQLDSNFKIEKGTDNLRWIDAFDPSVALRGLAWLEENRSQKSFRRLPDRVAMRLSEGVNVLSYCPSSAFLSFFTNSEILSVRWSVEDANPMDHMPSTGMSGAELYFRNNHTWYPIATARPVANETSYQRNLIENASEKLREYRLYLPLYKKLEKLSLGVETAAVVTPAPPPEGIRPIFFYGTSITQGGCAGTTGSDFVSHVGRLLDTEVINFGFSGNGRGEPEVAELIGEVDAEIFVLDYMANVNLEELATTLPEFIRILRIRHPQTPILLVSSPVYNATLFNETAYHYQNNKRDKMMEIYLKAKAAGDTSIYYVDGASLLYAGQAGAYVDGVHPTSHGFIRIAENLAPQITAIRLAQQF